MTDGELTSYFLTVLERNEKQRIVNHNSNRSLPVFETAYLIHKNSTGMVHLLRWCIHLPLRQVVFPAENNKAQVLDMNQMTRQFFRSYASLYSPSPDMLFLATVVPR